MRDFVRRFHRRGRRAVLRGVIFRVLFSLLALFLAPPVSAQNPVRLARRARVDLVGSPSVGTLAQGILIRADNGTMERWSWIADPAERGRTYTCESDICSCDWTEMIVEFTPQGSGTVDLILLGPWEESNGASSPIFRQEVLWDEIEVTNAPLLNGGFEAIRDGMPDAWFRPYGDAAVDSGPVTPVAGVRYARTWHDGRWQQTLPVTGGQRVRLRLFSRAQVPADYVDPHPVKLARTTRLDLMASTSVGAITGGTVLQGDGSMVPMNWIPAGDQMRSYTCEFRVIHFAWTEFGLQFTPQNSGTVDLSLMGPWEQSSGPGQPIFRQEVLWDSFTASGATLGNGGFETATTEVPSVWVRSSGDPAVESGPVPAVEGTKYARTWHDGQWRQTLTVTGGRTVTLHFFSRARLPDGAIDNPRINLATSPAHEARKRFMRGINLGNYLEAPAGQDWGVVYSAADFAQIRAEGFDHVRVPVRWSDHTGPAPLFNIDPVFAGKVDFLVNTAMSHGLAVLVDLHHFDAFTTSPVANTGKFMRIWEQVAARYATTPDTVAFELLNEPKDAATTAVLNPIYADTIRLIRKTNPNRTLFVGPGEFNSIRELPALTLPADDSNLIVTVHSYDPFLFTHQGATWAGDAPLTRSIVYPGPPTKLTLPIPPASNVPWVVDWFGEYNSQPSEKNPSSSLAFKGNLQLAKTWSDYYGRPVHVGEFGCYELADPTSRASYYRDMREAMESLDLGWAMWDWKAGFKYWDEKVNQPAPGLRNALFPTLSIRSLGRGRLQVESAVGRRHRILRSGDPTTAFSQWTVLADLTLTMPTLDYTDPNPPPSRAFYRVEWVK